MASRTGLTLSGESHVLAHDFPDPGHELGHVGVEAHAAVLADPG